MKLSNEEYARLVKEKEPPSPVAGDLVKAFVVGGLICCLGEALNLLYAEVVGLNDELSATAVSVTLVLLSVVLTGLNVYDKLARFAGAGTLVPITGFANSMASPAVEHRSEGAILGVAATLFSIAGPVIAYGIGASILYGIVLCLL